MGDQTEKTLRPVIDIRKGIKDKPAYDLTPEELVRREQIVGDYIRLLFDAEEKGITNLNENLGRVQDVETGMTRLDLHHDLLVEQVFMMKKLGITKSKMKTFLPDNAKWQHAIENPAKEGALFTSQG